MRPNYKKLSSHGSISIPVAMRREMGILGGDPMSVSLQEGQITITPYQPRCTFCGSTEDTAPFGGKHICRSCAQKAYAALLERREG